MELLKHINNKYRLNDLINKKIAIYTPDKKDLDMIQDKIQELNLFLQRKIGDYAYNTYEDKTCIDIVYKYDEKLGKECLNIFYADTHWYKINDYKIINIEDLIL